MTQDVLSVGFSLDVPLLRAEEESVRGERIRFVSGIASLEVEDQQKETVIQKGIDYSPLLETGYINWDHGDIRRGSPAFLIGEPTSADIRTFRGLPAFYIEGFLYQDKPIADEAWKHLLATSKSESRRKMGWSIQGHTMAAANGKILKSTVRDVALTHKPVLRETTVDFQEICKSMTSHNGGPLHLGDSFLKAMASAPVAGQSYGDLTATRTEDLAGAGKRRKRRRNANLETVVGSIWGNPAVCKSHCFDDDGRFTRGSVGMLDHLVTCLGWDVEDAEPAVRLLRGAIRD
jgi:hypothetical protein